MTYGEVQCDRCGWWWREYVKVATPHDEVRWCLGCVVEAGMLVNRAKEHPTKDPS